jgi:hypothetical protein
MERLAHTAKVGLGTLLALALFAIVIAIFIRDVTRTSLHRGWQLPHRRPPARLL